MNLDLSPPKQTGNRPWLRALLCLALTASCAEPGKGDVRVEVWGEDYIEKEIPAEAFEDGFRVEYDQFLITLGDVQLSAGPAGTARLERSRLFDLKATGPHGFGTFSELEAGAWEAFSYSVLRTHNDTRAHDGASAADLAWMRDEGYSVYVEGRATREAITKTFRWGFDTEVEYTHCVDTRQGQETSGLVVNDGASVTHQLTIHGDHLFYDDLASPDALLRFEAFAGADADEDGEVTLAELAEVSLSSLPASAGTYGVGAFNVDNLAQFVAAAVTTLGHFDGEGHCTSHVK